MSVSRFHDLRLVEHPNFPGAADLYRRMQGAPKFVFSRDITEWLKEHAADYDHAVAVAIEAERTELPYETMLVEWGHDTDELIFWLVDAVGPNSYRIWPAFHIPRAKRSMIFGDYFPASFASDGSAMVQPYQGWVPSPITRQFIDSYAPSAAISLCLAMTLHVRGIVTREATSWPAPLQPLDDDWLEDRARFQHHRRNEHPDRPKAVRALVLYPKRSPGASGAGLGVFQISLPVAPMATK